MAYSALNAVNILLKRVGVVAGDAGDITSFTDTEHQREIDIALQVWNEILDEAYSSGVFEGEVDVVTITLAADTREYSVPSDFEKFTSIAVFINANDSNRLHPYRGGYQRMYVDQPDPTDQTGQPHRYVINPQNSKVRVDTTPTSGEAGDVYTALYEKRINLSATGDTFPCSDDAVDSLIPSVAEIWRAVINRDSREGAYPRAAFARALKTIRQGQTKKSYGRHA